VLLDNEAALAGLWRFVGMLLEEFILFVDEAALAGGLWRFAAGMI
jgi:hypothetical protein